MVEYISNYDRWKADLKEQGRRFSSGFIPVERVIEEFTPLPDDSFILQSREKRTDSRPIPRYILKETVQEWEEDVKSSPKYL